MQTYSNVYDSYAQAEQAVTALEAAGVPSTDISLVANKYVSEKYANVENVSATATGAGLGAVAGGAAGLLAGIGLLAIPGLGPVVAVGWLASTAVGAAAGTAAGGIIGALIDAGVPADHAHVYSEAVRRGGTLLSVRVGDSDLPMARSILDRHASIDPVRRGAEYRKSGWRQFDPSAPDYVPEGIEVEKSRPAV